MPTACGTPYAAYQTFAMGTVNVTLFAQWAPAIITIAGTGTAGNTGDGGAATSAQLSTPSHIALDASGDLYIADYLNHRIRRTHIQQ